MVDQVQGTMLPAFHLKSYVWVAAYLSPSPWQSLMIWAQLMFLSPGSKSFISFSSCKDSFLHSEVLGLLCFPAASGSLTWFRKVSVFDQISTSPHLDIWGAIFPCFGSFLYYQLCSPSPSQVWWVSAQLPGAPGLRLKAFPMGPPGPCPHIRMNTHGHLICFFLTGTSVSHDVLAVYSRWAIM